MRRYVKVVAKKMRCPGQPYRRHQVRSRGPHELAGCLADDPPVVMVQKSIRFYASIRQRLVIVNSSVCVVSAVFTPVQ